LIGVLPLFPHPIPFSVFFALVVLITAGPFFSVIFYKFPYRVFPQSIGFTSGPPSPHHPPACLALCGFVFPCIACISPARQGPPFLDVNVFIFSFGAHPGVPIPLALLLGPIGGACVVGCICRRSQPPSIPHHPPRILGGHFCQVSP